ncbi:MAG: 3-dehydroquinate synthase [Myxococcota bacterium]
MTSANWLFLTGMMGVGKTTTGALLAEALGWRFVDLDQVLVEESGASVATLFERLGEPGFRTLEREHVERLLQHPSSDPASSQVPGTVVALGGGTFVQDGVRELLKPYGPVVYLDISPDELIGRLSGPEALERPLWGDAQALRALWAKRHSHYMTADHTIALGGLSPAAVCMCVLETLGTAEALEGFHVQTVALEARSYPIWIGRRNVEQAASLVSLQLDALDKRPSQVFIITDERVASLYLDPFQEHLAQGAWTVSSVVVPEGESSKSSEQLGAVLTTLLERQPGRQDMVVALGGGVVGDLAGFVAAILLRGVRFIQVPTTVLAQVDSSVGGKTGINHALGKNLVGAFHQPIAVVMALGMLQTLDRRQVSSGLAEVVKYAVLDSDHLLGELEQHAERLVVAPEEYGALIARCCAIKARIVADDEHERRNSRVLLNLGHTFGHAIEAMGGYSEVTHGEAVALGLLLAARTSQQLGLMALQEGHPSLEQRLRHLLMRMALPTHPATYLEQNHLMAQRMKQDKKAQGGQVTLILPIAPGDVRLHPVETDTLPALLTQLARGTHGG